MMSRSGTLSALAVTLTAGALCAGILAACSSSDDGAVGGGTPDSGGSSSGDLGDGGTSADGSSSTDGGITADGGSSEIPKPTACPATKFKTLVVVGDSISDVGGSGGTAGQQPFYRTLLVKNDDALYPEWKGFDLATCWGLADANIVKVSLGGAVATVPSNNGGGDRHILLNQMKAVPANLEGPVLVVGTIGGNDVQAGLITVLTGTPAQQQEKIDQFTAGFGLAMAEATKTDRFGAGVKTTVLMTNIYDPSGGTGHFYYEPKMATCPGALGLWPDNKATAPLLAQWNLAMANEAAKYPGVRVLELNAPFASHSVSTPATSNWFFQDCIHPSTMGHNAIRGLFWSGMVGLP
ncbi:MAG: hypothetical protein JWP97_4696 [Labilithrix sp.]|nr:hypothetical protein [Labilithrix sp.]